jgi:peptidoglycan glycosyltransferase
MTVPVTDRRTRSAHGFAAALVAIAMVLLARMVVVQLTDEYHEDPQNAFVRGVVEIDRELAPVVTADGVVVARSVADGDEYRRTYPIPSLAPLLGVIPRRGYPSGLELAVANGDLDGDPIELTVDAGVQRSAEAVAGDDTSILVLGVDGSILAAVDTAADPLAPIEDIAAGSWTPPAGDVRIYEQGDESVLFDRPVAAASTLKPFVVAGALSLGVVTDDEVFPRRTGFAPPGGRRISNYEGSACPEGTVVEGLARSCNSTAVDVAARLGASDLRDVLTGFGFGTEHDGVRPTTVSLGALSSGWPATVDEVSLATIGQGEARTTLLDLGLAYAALATGDGPPSPRLTADDPVEAAASTIEPEARAVVLEGMRAAADHGTASALSDLDVLAKTGTATRVDGEPASDGWVAVLAPADDPAYVVVVRIDGESASASGADAVQVASALLPTVLDHHRSEG